MSRTPQIFNNSCCLRCNETHKEMMRTGALVFCVHCFYDLFAVDYNIESKEYDSIYKKWLKKWYKLVY